MTTMRIPVESVSWGPVERWTAPWGSVIAYLPGCKPLQATGLVAVPLWVRYVMNANAVATGNVVIPLPTGAPDVQPGKGNPGRISIGAYDGDYEFVNPTTATATYDHDGGVPFITFEAEVPL